MIGEDEVRGPTVTRLVTFEVVLSLTHALGTRKRQDQKVVAGSDRARSVRIRSRSGR